MDRFIPARAGNTDREAGERRSSCGYGSSPRGRGTRARLIRARTRRLQPVHPRAGGEHAFACRVHGKVQVSAVHPRAGGEHTVTVEPPDCGSCRSVHPRAGGEHPHVSCNDHLPRASRFIPARAGNTSARSALRADVDPCGSSPRGRGTPPLTGGMVGKRIYIGSSPRGRGTRQKYLTSPSQYRFIPARAGNT